MEKILGFLFVSIFLIGCGSNETPEVIKDSVDAPDESREAEAQQMVVEYLWNTEGPDYSEGGLQELVADWNNRIDAGNYEMLGANLLRPQFETDFGDLVWVLLWPSQSARDAGWAQWNANENADWQNETKDFLQDSSEHMYAFNVKSGFQADGFELEVGESFIPNFYFCDLLEGKSQNDFDSYLAKYEADFATEEDSTEYGYAILEAKFPLENDAVWLDYFGSEVDMEVGSANWTGSESESAWNDLVACETRQFAGTVIR